MYPHQAGNTGICRKCQDTIYRMLTPYVRNTIKPCYPSMSSNDAYIAEITVIVCTLYVNVTLNYSCK